MREGKAEELGQVGNYASRSRTVWFALSLAGRGAQRTTQSHRIFSNQSQNPNHVFQKTQTRPLQLKNRLLLLIDGSIDGDDSEPRADPLRVHCEIGDDLGPTPER